MSIKKKIAIVTRSQPHGGGSFQYANMLLEALGQLDSTQFDTKFWYSNDAWGEIAAALPFPHFQVQATFPYWLRGVRKGLRIGNALVQCRGIAWWTETDPALLAIAKWRPDVCVCLEQAYNPLPPEIRVIGPIHDLMHRYEGRFQEVGKPTEYATREKLFSKHASSAAAILVDSEVGRQHVLESYDTDADKVHVLPFVASPLLQYDIERRPAKLPEPIPQFIFYPAQFWPHKNHEALLKALYIVREKVDLHCVFTGSTDKEGYAPACNLCAELGLSKAIHFLGYATDAEVAWLYRNAFAMVMPTFFGPTNIPPLEAMQYGCPAIVSNVYGMPEQLGEAVLYFDPSKPEEIAARIWSIVEQPELREQLVKKGRARVAQWSSADFQKRFLQILNSVL